MLRTWFSVAFMLCLGACNQVATIGRDVPPDVLSGDLPDSALKGRFRAMDGTELAFVAFEPPEATAAIVILPGFSESYVNYGELMADFGAQGYASYTMDLRGMGLSEHLAPNKQVVHVENFSDYVGDVDQFLREVVAPNKRGRPLFLFAHSTGALVATVYLASHPGVFHAAALSAPLYGLKTPMPEFLAATIVAVYEMLGFAKGYGPGGHDAALDERRFETNLATHSPQRYDRVAANWAIYPQLVVGGPSIRWIREILVATRKLPETVPLISEPLLIMQAGRDAFVRLEPQVALCRLISHCRIEFFSGSFHEILRERDIWRRSLLSKVLQLYASQRVSPPERRSATP